MVCIILPERTQRLSGPSKSGVSGGILCALSFGEIEQLKGPIGIGVFSSAIDEEGNSVVGLKFLQKLSQTYDLSIV